MADSLAEEAAFPAAVVSRVGRADFLGVASPVVGFQVGRAAFPVVGFPVGRADFLGDQACFPVAQ